MTDLSSLAAVQNTGQPQAPYSPVSQTGTINLPTTQSQADSVSDPISLFDLHQQFTSQPAVFTNAPSAVRSYADKYNFRGNYAPLADVIPQLPAPLRNTLIDMDQKRVERGQAVIPADDTLAAINTVLQNKPVTPIDKPNPILDLPNAALRDVRDIITNIPNIPGQLIHEVTQLPNIGEAYSKQIAAGANPVAAALASPGLRMIPGAFTLEQIASGHGSELLRHPVMTALDVLPYAEKGLAPILETPEAQAKIAALKESPAARRVANSYLGTTIREAIGPQAREVSTILGGADKLVRDMMSPESPVIESWLAEDPNKYREAELAKSVESFTQEYSSAIPKDRMAEIANAVKDGRPEVWAALGPLSDIEDAMASNYKTFQSKWEDYALTRQDMKEGLVKVENYAGKPGDNYPAEVFPRDQGQRILARRQLASYTQDMANTRDLIPADHPFDPTPPRDLIANQIADTSLGRARRTLAVDNVTHALAANGYNPSVIADALRDGIKSGDMSRALSLYDQLTSQPPRPPIADLMPEVHSLTSIVQNYRPNHPTIDPRLARMETYIQGGAWRQAGKELTNFRKVVTSIDGISKDDLATANATLDNMKVRLKDQIKVEKFYDTTKSSFTQKRAQTLANRALTREQRTLPARLEPLAHNLADAQLVKLVIGHDDEAGLIRAITERNYDYLVNAGVDIPTIRTIQKEAIQTAIEMSRDRSVADPVFVHRVDPAAAQALNNPHVGIVYKTPSSIKARTFDITPHYDDLTVALRHTALEWVQRRASQYVVDHIGALEADGGYGVRQGDLLQKYLPLARQYAAKHPNIDIASHADLLMRREWSTYDPSKIFPMGKPKVATGFQGDEILIPKVVANVMESYYKDSPGLVTKLTNPIMKVFRTSVLPLSPRFHLNTFLGGAIITMAETDPLTIWKFAKQALDWNRNPELVPEELRPVLGNAKIYQQDLLRMGAGAKAFDLSGWAQHVPGATQLGNAFTGVVRKAFDFHQFMDDMYRTMGYLYGYDKALNQGLSREASIEAGMNIARRVMPDWAAITPIERNVMRSVFPFYGFMSHIMRFALGYPTDHPWRTSIMSNFANAELHDMGEATPRHFLGLLKLPEFLGGGTDSQGRTKYINAQSFNPFRSATDIFTMAGFLSQANPLIKVALQQVGFDPRTSEADLNPDVQYDQETGKLTLKSTNPLANLLAATLPQGDLLAQLANPTSKLNQLRAADPEVAQNLMRSAIGLPSILKQYNLPQEQMKAELVRRDAVRRQVAASVKVGKYTSDNPVGQAYLNQLQAILERQPEALNRYTSQGIRQQIGVSPNNQTPGAAAITAGQTLEGILLGGGIGQ